MLAGIRQFDLTGRSAIVTGGTKGLGKAIAEGLASAGADVVIVSRHEEEGRVIAEQIAADYGRRAVACGADVSRPEDAEQIANAAIDAFGKIDVLVNNAGINERGPIDALTYEQFRRVMQTNVDGMWLVSRAVIEPMKRARSGRIINLASTLGVVGLQNRTPYATSKGAVVQMTRALGLELAAFDITCNAICPGPFLTPMNEAVADDELTRKFIVGAVALERWGRLEEIQGVAILLASDASSYMTGSLVTVDGGWTAR